MTETSTDEQAHGDAEDLLGDSPSTRDVRAATRALLILDTLDNDENPHPLNVMRLRPVTFILVPLVAAIASVLIWSGLNIMRYGTLGIINGVNVAGYGSSMLTSALVSLTVVLIAATFTRMGKEILGYTADARLERIKEKSEAAIVQAREEARPVIQERELRREAEEAETAETAEFLAGAEGAETPGEQEEAEQDEAGSAPEESAERRED